MAVEAAQFALADAAGEGRDMVDVGLGDHGRHGRGYVAGIELVAHMLVHSAERSKFGPISRFRAAMLRS